MKSKLTRCLIVFCGCYVAILALLMFFESKIVYPAPRGGNSVATDFGAVDVSFRSADGTSLHGWYFEQPGRDRTLVFFHGNAESTETSGAWIGEIAEMLDANVFIFDYRGYGKSDGSPFEKGVIEDGVAAIDWLSGHTGKPAGDIIFLARSLGGGVAVQVAKSRRPKAMILVSTFSSIVDAAQKVYWWVPVRLMMRNRYESEKAIAELDVPLLQLHGARDRLIPVELGRRLYNASPSDNKRFIESADHGHNGLPVEKFQKEILEFLDSLNQDR